MFLYFKNRCPEVLKFLFVPIYHLRILKSPLPYMNGTVSLEESWLHWFLSGRVFSDGQILKTWAKSSFRRFLRWREDYFWGARWTPWGHRRSLLEESECSLALMGWLKPWLYHINQWLGWWWWWKLLVSGRTLRGCFSFRATSLI